MRRVFHIHFLLVLCLCAFACAKDTRPQSELPAWDTDVSTGLGGFRETLTVKEGLLRFL